MDPEDVAKARHARPVRIPVGKLRKREQQIYEELKATPGEEKIFEDNKMRARIVHPTRRDIHWRRELEKRDPKYAQELLARMPAKAGDVLVIDYRR